ncbi:MAG TPA: 1-(5-phosphoribosyl)-5-[(5-phosphoribosylamino)methylideneamino]imidazole-4-carboxamide isomerase [Solirubrobacteraceae bacterium]|nr:1-(5-phosphoribosyl)-5-[(5-phosphoribosylamino)methylideneamino]imidazole-4-carboxamide isomerase [Solirubrobacteraceae bacterium]
MKLYPAIDMLDGKAVRLQKGDFAAKKVYDEDPLSAARAWVAEGAKRLHVVDLDGARLGAPANLEHLRRIVAETGVPVQFGGGLRSPGAVQEALAAGAARVILGTAAFLDPGFLADCLRRWPGQVLVSVDVRGGKVATAGWTETIDLDVSDVVEHLAEQGAHDLVFTNVDRDGMLEGPDREQVAEVAAAVKGSLVYSGGIGALADLEALAAVDGLDGTIVGKALYERRFTVAQAAAALRD